MAKKTTRPVKTAQQRNREEQWRRRVSAQGIATFDEAPVAVDSVGSDEAGELVGETAPLAQTTVIAPRPRPGTPPSSARPAPVSQRRPPAGAAVRASRLRPVATGLSMDEEMYYVRSDIRRLIILTAVCLAVLIALSLVIR